MTDPIDPIRCPHCGAELDPDTLFPGERLDAARDFLRATAPDLHSRNVLHESARRLVELLESGAPDTLLAREIRLLVKHGWECVDGLREELRTLLEDGK